MAHTNIEPGDIGLEGKFEVLAEMFSLFNFPKKPSRSSEYFRAVFTLYALDQLELCKIENETWKEWRGEVYKGARLNEDEFYLHEFTRRVKDAIDEIMGAEFPKSQSPLRQSPQGIVKIHIVVTKS